MNKRLIVIGLVCLTGLTARAQWWVGGSVSLRYNSTITLNP